MRGTAWRMPMPRRAAPTAKGHMPKWMMPDAVPQPEVEAVPERELQQLQDEAALPTDPFKCVVKGIDAPVYTGNAEAEFTIQACDERGAHRTQGGDTFFIAIRGVARVRARIFDHGNGKYTIRWKPGQSGTFSVAVSLFGLPLEGSPFGVNVHDPAPYAPHCEVRGEALHRVTARVPSSFEIRYRDRAGRAAQAVDLDVFVVPIPEPHRSPVQHTAWDIATQPPAEEAAASLTPSQQPSAAEDILKPPVSKKSKRRGGAIADDEGREGETPPEVSALQRAAAQKAAAAQRAAAAPPPAHRGGGGERGYGSADDELISPADGGNNTRRRAVAVQVLSKPLYVYADFAMREPIGMLQADQLATVMEERDGGEGPPRHAYTCACRCTHMHTHVHTRTSMHTSHAGDRGEGLQDGAGGASVRDLRGGLARVGRVAA